MYVTSSRSHASTLLTFVHVKANVLIDKTGRAHIADFGSSSIISDPANLLSSTSHTQRGTARWMSPERIDPERFGFKDGRPTISSDCYALGMVIYETIGGHPPFHKHPNFTVLVKILNGERPPRRGGFTEILWKMLELCWEPQPNARPGIEDVLQCLEMEPPSVGTDVEMEVDEVGEGMDEGSDDWYLADESCKFSHFPLLRVP